MSIKIFLFNLYLKKNIKINDHDFPEIMKDNIIFNQIKTLFWLEEQLKIQRYCVNYIYKSINTYNKKN